MKKGFFTINSDGKITSCVEATTLEEAELNDTLDDTRTIVCIDENDLEFIEKNLK